jgi:hypothetical protein
MGVDEGISRVGGQVSAVLGFPHIDRQAVENGGTGMTSAPHKITQPGSATSQVRLALKPAVGSLPTATGFVDGAWWPRSRDLAEQVPELVEALPASMGRIERVSYNLATWGPTIRRVHLDGEAVRLAGYHMQNPDTVDVLGRNHTVTLLVVPPATAEAITRRVLARACEQDNTDAPADLLATARASVPAPDAEDHSDSDGGCVDERVPSLVPTR